MPWKLFSSDSGYRGKARYKYVSFPCKVDRCRIGAHQIESLHQRLSKHRGNQDQDRKDCVGQLHGPDQNTKVKYVPVAILASVTQRLEVR